MRALLGYAVVVGGACVVGAGFLLELVFGGFGEGAASLRILALALPLLVLRLDASTRLVVEARERVVVVAGAVGLGTVALCLGVLSATDAATGPRFAAAQLASVAVTVAMLRLGAARSTTIPEAAA